MPMGEPVSGPRKWLRSATSIFSLRDRSRMTPLPQRPERGKSKRLDGPMPLSEFAKRQKTHNHSGHGRRDQLSAGERTRILRMLRDEGGRLADEDSQVFIGAAPATAFDIDLDDNLAPAPMPTTNPRTEVPAKPAVVVGLEQARRQKRGSGAPPPMPAGARAKPPSQPPPVRSKPPSSAPPPLPRRNERAPRAKLPLPFEGEPTRAAKDAELHAALRNAVPPARVAFFEEPTTLGNIDAALLDAAAEDHMTRPDSPLPSKFLTPTTEPGTTTFDDGAEDEATRLASVDSIKKDNRRNKMVGPKSEERTRSVDLRNDHSISDIDWDID
jgi:hypothetical protein